MNRKAEREVATATDGPSVAELRDMLEAACVLAEMDEVPAKVTVLWWRAALRGEKPPTPSLPEAVAGNASAPVGVQQTTFLSIFASKISALYGIADDLAEQCEALEKEQRNA